MGGDFRRHAPTEVNVLSSADYPLAVTTPPRVDLANAVDEQAMLDEIEAGFEKIASDPQALAAYRAESAEIEAGFGAPIPDW